MQPDIVIDVVPLDGKKAAGKQMAVRPENSVEKNYFV
jgi:hypothetical protein